MAIFGLLILGLGVFDLAHGETAGTDRPVTCRIGVNVEDLYDLDMARDTFSAILWVWSLCPADQQEPLDAIAFPSASAGLNLGPIKTVDTGSADRYTYRRVQGPFRFNWDMSNYPFDRHRLVIPMDETQYSTSRLVFEADRAASFLTPDIRNSLPEWRVSDLTIDAALSDEASNYGLPNQVGARYARVEASFTLDRVELLTFLKLISPVLAAVFIAFLSFFYDPNDKGSFGSKLGLLVGILFAIILSLRSADASIGDTGRITMLAEVHLVAIGLVVVLACLALRDRRRVERGQTVRHPDWPTLAMVGGLYLLTTAGLVGRAALS
jgi:hypothetical protein